VGAQQFAAYVEQKRGHGDPVQAFVLLDMVGDADQKFFYEGNSNPELRKQIWDVAEELGMGAYFLPTVKYTMTDDHLPFVALGIPAVDIIDFDYPYWHTRSDTIDKVSPDSLERIGRVLIQWLLEK
jgi:glutaminyl-peptide cyclotransferase